MRSHLTNRSWTSEHVEELRKLVEAGASSLRAAARLRRTATSVQIKAKESGFPFTDKRIAKRRQRAREAEIRRELGLE
ncbi:hypothetical protein [Bradyrhizobium sp. SYSU BS000235]|uniref:hypothetical protein n=1 Tax=Bradyrhizobium sp. SYSU BS000235 TaxID=3411332 RepID=UPI003C782F0D